MRGSVWAPCAPVTPHSRQPRVWPLGINACAEIHGQPLELLLPRGEHADQLVRRWVDAFGEHVQIMMIAENVRELVELIAGCLHHRRPHVAQELGVIPVHLRLLAPLVHLFGRVNATHRPPTIAIGAPQSAGDGSEGVRQPRPEDEPSLRHDQLVQRIRDEPLERRVRAIPLQRAFQSGGHGARKLELFQRFEDGIGIADGGEIAARIAEPRVLRDELRPERLAHHA